MPTPSLPGANAGVQVAPALDQPYSLQPLPPAAAATPPAQRPQPVALVLCHGMGQQMRHDTLAEAARNLHPSSRKPGTPPATMRYVRFRDAARPGKAGRLLPRAEIEVEVPGTAGQYQEVHVYEVYWAPLTEGQIGLSDVVRFLLKSGVGGLNNTFNTFRRWLFGAEVFLPVGRYTFLALFGLLLLILSLVAINTLITLVLSENLLATATMQRASPRLVNVLTLHLASLLGLAALLYGSLRLCASRRSSTFRGLAVGLVWALLSAVALLLVGAAISMAYHYFSLRADTTTYPPESLVSWRKAGIGIVWLGAVVVSWQCRTFLVQYLGDVVIYVDAYNVDRFFAIRGRIRRLAHQCLEAVYGARKADNPDEPLYRQVVVAGHSLGSLVAYEGLNTLLLADEAAGQQLQVRDRTPALVTFGSPLDKTTFLFHAKPQERPMYTGLDTARQPLIRDPAARQAIQWINLHSSADVVSGPLNYFNDPTPGRVPDVLNIADPDAYVPVLAHTQYWWGGVLGGVLRKALCGQRIQA